MFMTSTQNQVVACWLVANQNQSDKSRVRLARSKGVRAKTKVQFKTNLGFDIASNPVSLENDPIKGFH